MSDQLNLFGFESVEILTKPDLTSSLYEYFFFIAPSAEVRNEINFIRQQLNNELGLQTGYSHPPNIALLHARLKGMKDSGLLARIRTALLDQTSFRVDFKEATIREGIKSNDIILNVANAGPVKEIYKCLAAQFDAGKANQGFVPHVALAKGISHKDMLVVQPRVEQYNIESSFVCRAVNVLKREVKGKERGKFIALGEVALNQSSFN